VAQPCAWIRLFSYAAIGGAAGYLLLAFTGLETELVVLFAFAVFAGIASFVWRREGGRSQQTLVQDAGEDDGSYDETQRERWRRDLDIAPSVAGVRGFSIDGDDWRTPEVDPAAGDIGDTNRE